MRAHNISYFEKPRWSKTDPTMDIFFEIQYFVPDVCKSYKKILRSNTLKFSPKYFFSNLEIFSRFYSPKIRGEGTPPPYFWKVRFQSTCFKMMWEISEPWLHHIAPLLKPPNFNCTLKIIVSFVWKYLKFYFHYYMHYNIYAEILSMDSVPNTI